MNARQRILALNKPNRPDGPKWIDKVEREQKGKPRNSGNDLPADTFTMGPGNIAQTLKMKSKDFQQAIQRLQFYINRSGDNLSSEDQMRLERAKDALYRAYGKQPPAK